jgi:hypothetical protein
MPKYCPVCLGEYQDNIKECPKDKSLLLIKKPSSYERLVNCYLASNEIEAEHIISLLNDEGIVARVSTTGISQVPVASEQQFVIAVIKEEIKRAKLLIEQARRDGIISQNGSFC